MTRVLDVVVEGPLECHAVDFVGFMAARGYAVSTIQVRMRLVAHLSQWCIAEVVELAALDAATIARYLSDRRRSHSQLSSEAALEPLVMMLRHTAAIPPAPVVVVGMISPIEAVVQQWVQFLAVGRGVGRSTIRYYTALALPFLRTRIRGEMVDWEGLDAVVVAGFVRQQLPMMSAGTAQLTVTALRSLLRFLFSAGLVGVDLSPVVTGRSGYRDSGLPKGLSGGEVAALLAVVGRPPLSGLRDRSMVLLMLRLGLRAGEVAGLRLDDIDWRAGTIRVRGKGNQADVVPMPVDVGEAMAEHLQQPRHPAMAGRSLFFASIAPYRAMTAETVKAVVTRAGHKAGLGHISSHQLRHTVATATINAGASLEEVGQLLRHRHLGSTTIYAKVDLSRLSTLARPWPGALRDTAAGAQS